MRNLLLAVLGLLSGNIISAQSFSVSCPDTIAFGAAVDSATLSCWNNNYVTNLTENALELDVIRIQDDTATPGWTSSFCFQYCSLPNVDSIRANLLPNEAVNIAIHFHITGTPDSGSVLMKYRNVNYPSEVLFQKFYAFSSPVSVNSAADNSPTEVHLYPSPAISQQNFTMQLEGQGFVASSLTLDVFDMCGRKVVTQTGLHPGSNNLSLDIPSGVYTYSISGESQIVYTGKLVVTASRF